MAIRDRDFEKAARIVKDNNALPAICGRVCPQEDQCEKVCVIGIKQEPVAIGRLERFIADWERDQGKLTIPEHRSAHRSKGGSDRIGTRRADRSWGTGAVGA